MFEPNCDMPWEIYLDWLQDQGYDELRFIYQSCLAIGVYTFFVPMEHGSGIHGIGEDGFGDGGDGGEGHGDTFIVPYNNASDVYPYFSVGSGHSAFDRVKGDGFWGSN